MLLLHGGNTGFSMSMSAVVTGNNFAMISEHRKTGGHYQ